MGRTELATGLSDKKVNSFSFVCYLQWNATEVQLNAKVRKVLWEILYVSWKFFLHFLALKLCKNCHFSFLAGPAVHAPLQADLALDRL